MWRLVAGLVTGFVIGLLMATMIPPANAHEAIPTAAAPLGWSYPSACCSGYDCAQAAGYRVFETPKGYSFTIKPGQHQFITEHAYTDTIPYGDKRIKNSPDGRFHVCLSSAPERKPSRTICLYVPPRGF